jgi:L-lactate dehydrogenase complex protein LldG
MTSREDVLARIRAALDDGGRDVGAIPRDYQQHSELAAADVIALFARRVGEYQATVHTTSPAQLPSVVAAILSGAGALVVPDGLPPEWLAELDPDVAIHADDPALTPTELAEIDAVITGSAVAIAETGTVVLDGSPQQGRRALSLVPDHHVCVVTETSIVATVPQGLAAVDHSAALTMISGPSATSDIELDRVEGVHGPRRLDVVIVRAQTSAM